MTNPEQPLPVGPVLAATMLTQVLMTLAGLALSAIAPSAAASLGVDASLVGYQVSLVYFGAVLTSLIGGPLVRRFGPTRLSQLALVMGAAGCVLSAAGGLPGLIVGAWIIGLGYGCTNPAAALLISRIGTSRHMNLIFSVKQCGVPIGGVLAGLLLPPVVLLSDWRGALVVCAVLAVLSAIALERWRSRWDVGVEPDTRILAAPFAGLALIWKERVLRWLALGSLAYSAVQLSLTGFLVTFLVAEANLSLMLAGTVLAVVQTSGAVGRLCWGWIADRLGSGLIALTVNGAIAIPAALLTAGITAQWPLLQICAVTALFGFCTVGWNGVFMAVIARHAPVTRIGQATGGTLSVTFAGVLVGPSAFSALHDHLGLSYASAYGLMAMLTLGGVACLLMARNHARRRAP